MTVFTWTFITHGLLSVSSTPSRIPGHPHNRTFRLAALWICATEIAQLAREGNGLCSLASGLVNRDSSGIVQVTQTLWGLDVPSRAPRRVQQIVARRLPPAAPVRRTGAGRKPPGESPYCSSESLVLQLGSAPPTCSRALADVPGCHCPRQRS